VEGREGTLRPPWQKDNRILAAIAAVLGIVLTSLYGLFARTRTLSPSMTTNRVLLFVLFYIVVVLILALLFVLGRSAIKLLLESRRGVFGSKFRSRVVATHIGLAFLPIAVLLLPISGLIQKSTEYWFEPPVVQTVKAGKDVSDLLRERTARLERQAATALSARLVLGLDDAEVLRHLSEVREASGLDFLEWRPNPSMRRLPVAVSTSRWPVREVSNPDEEWFREARERGLARRIEPLSSGGQVNISVSAVSDGYLLAGTFEPPVEAAAVRDLARATSTYAMLQAERASLQATQILLFLLIAFVVLLAAVWAGLLLSRRVTRPIALLAKSVRQVGSGDFSVQVEVESQDEIGSLASSFNAMTSELKTNREKLEKANEELAASNRRLDEALDGIETVLAHIDAGVLAFGGPRNEAPGVLPALPNVPQAPILQMNDAAARILGARVPAGTCLSELLSFEGFRPLRDFLCRAFVAGGAREANITLKPQDGGEPRIVEVRVAAIPGGETGVAAAWVVTLEDTTALVRAERAAAWEEAARRMAHEIKNPLTPIRLAAERMAKKSRQTREKATPPTDLLDAVEEGALTIVEEVKTLSRLVDAFGRFARLPAAKMAPTDLAAVVAQVVKLYAGTKPGVIVTADLPEQLPPVPADGEQIKRALINFVDNAVSATPAGGTVRVAADVSSGIARLLVEDDGPGIPDTDRHRIFDPAFSTKGRGTGLGLAITARIAAEHAGRVRVEENEPHGSRFTFEWPVS
jgi:two-component system nitrogen regulation sensor histidine kinase NtrY